MSTKCGEKFDVSGTGTSREAAKNKAHENASNFCRKTLPSCPRAEEAGKGQFKDSGDGNITHITEYRCTIEV